LDLIAGELGNSQGKPVWPADTGFPEAAHHLPEGRVLTADATDVLVSISSNQRM
jgi:hypothetical protein